MGKLSKLPAATYRLHGGSPSSESATKLQIILAADDPIVGQLNQTGQIGVFFSIPIR